MVPQSPFLKSSVLLDYKAELLPKFSNSSYINRAIVAIRMIKIPNSSLDGKILMLNIHAIC